MGTLTYQGKTQTLAEWAKQYEMGTTTLIRRLSLGWDAEQALTTPVREKAEDKSKYTRAEKVKRLNLYQSGDWFTVSVAATWMHMSNSGIRDILEHMVKSGQLEKRASGNHNNYRKPRPSIISLAWTKQGLAGL